MVHAVVSPLGVLLALPCLVVVVAVTVGGIGAYALRQSVDQLARTAFDRTTENVIAVIDTVSGSAEPMLDAWSDWLRGPGRAADLPAQAAMMRALITDRPGIAWLSRNLADGSTLALHRTATGLELVHHDGNGTRRLYAFAPGGTLAVREHGPSDYDPRQRPFWDTAVDRDDTGWTAPYLYAGGEQGITAARALRGADGSVQAVLTVDFSFRRLTALTTAVSRQRSAHVFVATADGKLLAWPGGHHRRDAIPHLDTVDDPLIDRLLAAWRERDDHDDAPVRFAHAGQTYLGLIRSTPLGDASVCRVGVIAPLDAFLAPTWTFRIQALVAGVLSVAAALAVTLLLARTINRHRRALRVAESAIADARERERELGSYRLLRKLGAGGMGEVWLGTHRLLARPAAIKLIKPAHDPAAHRREHDILVERFAREARTTAALRSRHTVEIYDYGTTDDGTLYLVMELLDGLDLHDLLARHGPQPVARVVAILRQACRSLAEAHRLRLVHRDIKPGNLFLCRRAGETDIVKLLDFGMVLDHDQGTDARLTRTGFVSGTPSFMSPEQARALPVDGRSDLYALACVAFFLLTGRHLFVHATAREQMLAHVDQPPPPCSRHSPRSIPQALDELLLRCLAKDPADRPADGDALDAALATVPIPPGEEWGENERRAWWDAAPRTTPDVPPPAAATPIRLRPTVRMRDP